MKRSLLPVLILLLLGMLSCNTPIGSVLSGVPIRVTNMNAVERLIGGPTLQIELTPTNQVKAGMCYIMAISEKSGAGRMRTYVMWSQPEMNMFKPRIVNAPLSYAEMGAYRNATSSKLMSLFQVDFEREPVTEDQVKTFIKSGTVRAPIP